MTASGTLVEDDEGEEVDDDLAAQRLLEMQAAANAAVCSFMAK